MFLLNHILQEGDEVALFMPTNLHHFIGHYRKRGLLKSYTIYELHQENAEELIAFMRTVFD